MTHVVMTVGNPVQNDARVRKAALTVAATGAQVTLLGLSPDGTAFEESIPAPDGNDVRILNVPVNELVKRTQTAARIRRRKRALFLAYPDRDSAVAAIRRRTVWERELEALRGRVEKPGRPEQLTMQGMALVNKVLRKIVSLRSRLMRAATSTKPLLPEPLASNPRLISWRRLLPELHDMEMAFGPVLDDLAPDVIHAHDIYMIGIVERAVARAKAHGRQVRWIYDAHEFVPGMSRYAKTRIAALAAMEAEYIGRADAVITVSEPIADAIQARCHLAERPKVVLNVPALGRPRSATPPSVRAVVGLADDVPLLVYSGNIDPDRGVTTLVESLAHLDGVHVVIVTNAPEDNRYVLTLRGVAAAAGAGGRLHLAPYVDGDDIIDYLGSATVGVHGLSHVPNHEMALPNKLFDYLHAGLPVVVSDVKAMSAFVTELGIGEVYTAGDPVSLAAAAQKVLADRERYARASRTPELLERYSWETQEATLRNIYAALLAV